MSISLGSTTYGSIYLGSTKIGEAYLGSVKVYSSQIVLPANTIRCKFASGYTPAIGVTQTLVDSAENIWDIYMVGTRWGNLFSTNTALISVIAANTTGVIEMTSMFEDCSNLTTVSLFDTSSVGDMAAMFSRCSNLTSVPLFNTSSVTNMIHAFSGCYKVQSGALALYQQASTQATPPPLYFNAFAYCGRDTVTGAAELAQIPSDWGGTGA